jgi:hypothetical protein
MRVLWAFYNIQKQFWFNYLLKEFQMKRSFFLFLPIAFLMFACDDGVSNGNSIKSDYDIITNDYDVGSVDENLVGIWLHDGFYDNMWYVFNSDGTGYSYYSEDELVRTSYKELRWGVKEDILCIRFSESVSCCSFNVENDVLSFGVNSLSKVENPPVLRSK